MAVLKAPLSYAAAEDRADEFYKGHFHPALFHDGGTAGGETGAPLPGQDGYLRPGGYGSAVCCEGLLKQTSAAAWRTGCHSCFTKVYIIYIRAKESIL